MVYGAVPVKDEENPLLGVRSSSKRPRSFAYGVIAVVCVAALAISGVSRATDESSREDHLSALGDLSNDYLAKRSWWQDVKTANETLITAKQASDKAMEAAAEAEEKFDELKLDAEEKDRMCTDIHKAEDQTSGCDDHCSTGAVQASRLGWGSWFSSWWRSVAQRAVEAAKKAAEAKKAKCMETCKNLKCGLPKCLSKSPIQTGGSNGSYGTKKQYYAFHTYTCRSKYRHCDASFETFEWVQKAGFLKPDSNCKFGSPCYSKYANYHGQATVWLYGGPAKLYSRKPGRNEGDDFTDPCTFGVSKVEDYYHTYKTLGGRYQSGPERGHYKHWIDALGVGSDYFSECGKCTD